MDKDQVLKATLALLKGATFPQVTAQGAKNITVIVEELQLIVDGEQTNE